MKRFPPLSILCCIAISFFVLSILVKPIYAIESKIIKKVPDGTNTFIDISQGGSDITRQVTDPKTKETHTEIIGKHFNYESKVGPNTLETPDNKQMYEQWLWQASQALTPQMIQDASDDPNKYYDQSISGRSFLCVYNPGGSLQKRGPGNENGGDRAELRSEKLSWLNYMRRTLRQIRLVLSPVGGDTQISQKYNDYTMDLTNPPECTDNDNGKRIQSAPTAVVSTGFFSSVWDWINSILGSSKGDSSVKTLTPGRNYITNFVEVPVNQLKGTDSNNASSYGTVEGMLPDAFAAFSVVPGTAEQKEITIGNTTKTADIGYDYASAAEQGKKSLQCAILPDSLQPKLGIASQCSNMPKRGAQGARPGGMGEPPGIPLPGEDVSCSGDVDAMCEQLNNKFNTFPNAGCSYSGSTIEGSSELKNTFEKSGNYFGIPPQMLAGVAWIENRGGVFKMSSNDITNGKVTAKSSCGAVGVMQVSYDCNIDPSCPAGDKAKGNWEEWCKHKGAAGALRGNASYVGSPENIKDSIAVAAHVLEYNAFAQNTGSCDTNQWNETTVKKAAELFYQGQTSDSKPNTGLYSLLIDQVGVPKSVVDQYAKSQANALTYGEFVWAYMQTHK